QGRFLEAAGDFGVCSACLPDFAWTHFNRGLALAKAGRLLDAKDAYDRAVRIDDRFAEALVDRALVELELNQLEPALADLTRARTSSGRSIPTPTWSTPSSSAPWSRPGWATGPPSTTSTT